MKDNIIFLLNVIRTIPAITAYLLSTQNQKDTIRKDIERNFGEKHCDIIREKWMKFLVVLLAKKKVFRNIFYFRIKNRHFVLYLMSRVLLPELQGCEISGEIGPGLAIWHGYNTVISCHSIGKNFSCWQGVTIGRNPKEGIAIDKPTIGDDCAVFTNAVVAGGIILGNNVRVGAGTVCMKNVPDNSLVISAEMKVIEDK